eukprot:4461588-Ditylum_brightwellii.AAC.1
MMLKDYGLKKRPILVRNPQANSIIERIHQTIGSMIRSFEVHSTDINEKDPWTGILSAVRFATRATVHTTMQATPMKQKKRNLILQLTTIPIPCARS